MQHLAGPRCALTPAPGRLTSAQLTPKSAECQPAAALTPPSTAAWPAQLPACSRVGTHAIRNYFRGRPGTSAELCSRLCIFRVLITRNCV